MLQGTLLAAALSLSASTVSAMPLVKRDAQIVQTTPYGYYAACASTPHSTVIADDAFWPHYYKGATTVEECLLLCAESPATNPICIVSGDGSVCAGLDTSLPGNGFPSDFRYLLGAHDSDCTGHPCAGDASEECGGADYVLLYGLTSKIEAPTPSSTTASSVAAPSATATATKLTSDADWTYSGCYTDSIAVRTLVNGLNSQSWTVQNCLKLASAAGYTYGGVEYSGEWGANSISATATLQDESNCSMACADDNTYTCGGNNSIEVYKTTKEVASSTSTTTSSAPAATAPVDLASTKLVSSKWTYSGCFTDAIDARALPRLLAPAQWSASSCAAAAEVAGLNVIGLEYGGECWAGTALPSSAELPASSCAMTCNDAADETCGGGNALDVYTLPSSTSSTATRRSLSVKGLTCASVLDIAVCQK